MLFRVVKAVCHIKQPYLHGGIPQPLRGVAQRPSERVAVEIDHAVRQCELFAQAAQRVGAQYPMGAQYGWLPRLVPLAGWQVLEFSHENDGRYKFVPLASFRRNPAPAPDDWFVVDESACDADRYRVFGGFRYPVLDVTKRQMAQRARSGGFEAILDQAWSCRWPTLRGTPCGQCSPCRQIREAGLTDRVPPDTAVRRTVHRWHWDWVRRGESARIRARSIRARLARR